MKECNWCGKEFAPTVGPEIVCPKCLEKAEPFEIIYNSAPVPGFFINSAGDVLVKMEQEHHCEALLNMTTGIVKHWSRCCDNYKNTYVELVLTDRNQICL